MASLYDLEVVESNQLIHAFMNNGETAELHQMRQELEDARQRGPEGSSVVEAYLDQSSPSGSKLKRFTELESDIKLVMSLNDMSPDLANNAYRIFMQKPESLVELNSEDRQVLTVYWLKKKTCFEDLQKRGYSLSELFSTNFSQE